MAIPFLTDDIADKIEDLAAESEAIYGTTAFWTIHPDYFYSPSFLNVLSQETSFFIVDISEPTIVENLVAYAEQDANLYIYLRRAKDKLYKYNHLLHSKIMLFQHRHDNEYTLLIGSANMTTRAIKGINQEAGVQISLSENDVLLHEVKDYLQRIKRNSIKIDPSKLALYKFIQDQKNLDNFYENCPLLYLAAKNEEYQRMIPGNIIQMMGLNDEIHEFYDQFESLNNRIALLVENIETNDSMVCVCSLKSIGEVNINNPETYQKDYEERLIFYIGLTEFNGACTPALVLPSMKISKQMFYVSDFHTELIIDEIHSNVFLNEFSIKRKINPWKDFEIILSNENFTLDRKFSSLENRMPENSIRKGYKDNIKIEEISKDCFKEEFYRNLLNELSPSKLKLEKIEPPRFHQEYLMSVITINKLISEISLTNEARNNIKKKIEEILVGIYNSSKKENQKIHKNIRLLKPCLVYKNDRN